MALCWTDLKDSQLSITKAHTKQTEQGGYEIKTPKSSSSIRVVSINKSLNDYLLEYKQESPVCLHHLISLKRTPPVGVQHLGFSSIFVSTLVS